jgi:hypothetical protein
MEERITCFESVKITLLVGFPLVASMRVFTSLACLTILLIGAEFAFTIATTRPDIIQFSRPTFRIFSDIEAANIQEPHAPGDKPSAARYIYNWWIEYAPFETEFYLATSWKKPVTKDFTEHFLFLTEGEIANLRKWMSRKGK